MIDLAIALALQQGGFGTYGKEIRWNSSAVMGTGTVTGDSGLWVNSTPQDVTGDWYTDTVTISSRDRDPIRQGLTLLKLMNFLRGDWAQTCTLSTEPIVPDLTFTNVKITPPTSISIEAVDGEGRWVKAIQFIVKYKVPETIPDMS